MTDDSTSPRRTGRIWAGLFLVCVGAVLVLDQMGFPLPDWLFSWHFLLIGIGIFIGFRHGFRGGFWLILILLGTAFEFQDYYPRVELHRFILPGVLILIGILFVLNPGRNHYSRWQDKAWKAQWKSQWKNDWRARKWGYHVGPNPDQFGPNPGPGGPTPGPGAYGPGTSNPGPGGPIPGPGATAGGTTATGSGYSGYSAEDYIDSTAFFGGVHKKIVSKNFKGGDVVTIMGGTEIDLSQADFMGTVRLDVVQIMGATKIIVPAHWEVRTDVTAIFAGFEDKRQQPTVNNPDKVLLIDGTSLFGGIELKNF
ncbi:MAG TPA: LiaF domain-containing protein [Puia sp.]|nr:LiaF domain-containing protein [Puia sp.]